MQGYLASRVIKASHSARPDSNEEAEEISLWQKYFFQGFHFSLLRAPMLASVPFASDCLYYLLQL